jgi:pyrroline-5-carboxylate reductase
MSEQAQGNPSDEKRLKRTIGFIGAGNMAEAMIKGLLQSGLVEAEEIAASEPRRERVKELADKYGIYATAHNEDAMRRSEIVVLSVKPQILLPVCDEVSPWVKPHGMVISIAAGVPIAVIESHLPPKARLVRAMPNTPALVGAGATALAAGTRATDDDMETARRVFDSIGKTVILDEGQLDAVTGLSGSGPAYVFLIIEALSDAGVKVGLSRYNALALAAQTVLGSAKLLLETGEHPGRLKDMVTSPGGTAIAGLHTLEAGGLRTTLMDAVEAAARRSRELGEAALASESRRVK